MGGSYYWWGVLAIAAVTLQLGLCQSPEPDIQEEVSLTEMVELYNQREEGEFLYKLLASLPVTQLEDEEEMKGDSPAPSAAFLMKETECPKVGTSDTDLCDYKQDGEVKVCALYPEEDQTSAVLKCLSMNKNLRAKRASKKKKCGFMCNAGKKLRSAVGSGALIMNIRSPFRRSG